MIVRISTYIFYAVLFFALGAWSGGHFRPIWDGFGRATRSATEGGRSIWHWAQGAPDAKSLSAGATSPAPVASLANARTAFAQGDIQTAIDAYRGFLDAHPGDIAARGELGNVYFNSGRTAEAAEAYHAAALAMIAAGNADDARGLIPAIRSAAPALASDIEHRVTAAQKQSKG